MEKNLTEKTLTIGVIAKPQGIRGEVKVIPYTDGCESFSGLKRVFIDGEEVKILSVRLGADAVFLGLKGVPDRNAAELLRGKELTIPREEAPDPGEGRFYIADLLGAEIVTEEGELLGVLKEIRQASADIYFLDRDGKEILFPAVKGVITGVNVAEKRITVCKKRFDEVAVI